MSKLVFIVDDTASNLLQAKEVLQRHYSVMTLSSAQKMFDALEKKQPELILLDIEMPDTNGFDAIKKLKNDLRFDNIPVIFCTAQQDPEIEKKGYELGAVDFITKPFTGEGLLHRVRIQIETRSLFSELIEYSPMFVEIWDSEQNFCGCNQKMLDMFGLKSQSEYIERYLEFIPETQPCGLLSVEMGSFYSQEVLKRGSIRYEWLRQLPDGNPLPCEVAAFRIERGGKLFIVSYNHDLRTVKAAMERAHKAEMELREQEITAKNMFIANMSHEIRTPMNSIIGFSELAMEEEMSDKAHGYLQRITESADWLLQIINDILDITKIESGKMELELVPFDFGELFDGCRSLVAPAAAEKGLSIHFYTEPFEDGKMLLGDPTKLRQIFVNLLSNAVKFTDAGVVRARTRLVKETGTTKTIACEIKDSGIGMSAEQVEKVFEPFTQADTSITRKYGGTGLGLAIVKSLLEMMGGELAIDSAPGAGSTFSFELTFETVTAPQKQLARQEDSGKLMFGGEVLVCEDNPVNQIVINEHLLRVGLRGVIAENGLAGVEKVRDRIQNNEKPFDIIFMDMQMPVMGGLEASENILNLDIETPIVAMTANVMTHDKENYRKRGMADVIGKPFTSVELRDCLLKFLKPVKPIGGGEPDDSASDAALMHKTKLSFVKNNRNMFKQIAESIETDNMETAHRLAHSLKSNAGFIGEDKLQKIAANVEKSLKDGRPADEVQLRELENELTKVLNSLIPLFEVNEAESEAVSADEPVSKSARELAEILEPMLISRNVQCLGLLPKVRVLPNAAELADQIESYDFKKAVQTLAKLKDVWGI